MTVTTSFCAVLKPSVLGTAFAPSAGIIAVSFAWYFTDYRHGSCSFNFCNTETCLADDCCFLCCMCHSTSVRMMGSSIAVPDLGCCEASSSAAVDTLKWLNRHMHWMIDPDVCDRYVCPGSKLISRVCYLPSIQSTRQLNTGTGTVPHLGKCRPGVFCVGIT